MARFTLFWAVLGLATVVACQFPLAEGARAPGVWQLTLHVTPPGSGSSSARLLLPNAQTITVTVTDDQGAEAAKQSSPLVGSEARFQLPLKWLKSYTAVAEATDAAGTVLFSGTSSPIQLNSNVTATLYLLPVAPSGSPWPTVRATDQPAGGPSGSLASLASLSSTTFVLDFGTVGSVFTLQDPGAGLTAYAQQLSGAPLTFPVSKGSLEAGTQFLVTYYNESGAAAGVASLGHFTIPVQALAFTQGTSQSLGLGQTLTLSPVVTPANADDSSVTWTTSDSAVATVSSAGLLTAKAMGSATIVATARDGSGVTASFDLTVTDPGVGLTFGFPTEAVLGFNLAAITVNQGSSLTTTTSSSLLASDGTAWQWRADNTVLGMTQSTNQFTVDTSALAPGTYDLTVFVTLDGVGYSASIPLTIVQVTP